ncbi:MAG: ATP-dependent RNA helicase HrpA [Opitutus sp.]|nr:ATP-dependent RNA helicase HrpA [Opitutus sp.]MCS6246752.1 ATP-dependent RNA helicase HrpA [Opitutus sp.]MCS6273286.1 ATP-dependent RNA helicase HrpA [Opitutus sp.]MCS6276176.1 ATP-dependent RNA helicase HrpA [Opitutus sp.]MCS6301270.1 ATP-dependent RNA helicase HrpA [Opitutus sp.]
MARSDDRSPPAFRIDFPPELPISSRASEIVDLIAAHQVIILAGETGSGKTTQIPKMCLAAGRGVRGVIACTQPRRVAALSVSRRVAEELNVPWGGPVGCKIRFDDRTTRDTVIKFMTDGMLLAEVQNDPMLRAYDTVILDEAHERSLNIDFLLGHLRNLRHQRPELKIIVTSATIDTEAFSKAFDGAPIVQVSGRTYPVEVIYAPLDSLGSDAAEGDERSSRSEALHYIDGAAEAVERILRDSASGDILVFLPAERDIRETTELLEGRRLPNTEIVPLFGRLSNSEQQRVFASSQRRKLILATNIAETSLTIPGIRYVVDTGLARISRYSPQARTRRLPIEAVAQSSADQRKGRAGRVADGVCIRLYSEADFNERPRFTQPEIQRANLADVILRMKAFGLGDIERFPFINMPAAKSIRAGYALLEEIGALDSNATEAARQLTPVGRELARLPVDPTVGRMILQARTEKAVREVLVIASGLSIQDPRERPMEAREKADLAHRRFNHPDSDYLALLNIWDAYHEQFDRLSQARLRRFCKDHFLSYTRMREWRDVHSQLLDVMEQRKDFQFTSIFDGIPADKINADKTAFASPGYRAIHRSILAGLLGNIATRDDDNGGYKATHDRRVALFPGSVLFVRDEKKSHSKRGEDPRQKNDSKNNKSPRWIMSAEIMETTRLFARTSARMDPLWALDLGSHVVKVAHSEPFWNQDAGRVMVKQRTRLYGLELESRAVSYGKVNPVHATEIFIREALVNDQVTWPLDFIAHNRGVREEVENLLTRTRDSGYLNLDEGIYRFYAARLIPESGKGAGSGTGVPPVGSTASPDMGGDAHATSDTQTHGRGRPCHAGADRRGTGVPPVGSTDRNHGRDAHATLEAASNPPFAGVSSVAELVDLVRERKGAEPRFLMFAPDDLRDPEELQADTEAYPEAMPLQQAALPLNYAYKPGQTDDGVTLDVPVRVAADLTPAALDWAVPGHLAAKVEHYLRALPKELRRDFVPLGDAARQLAKTAAQHTRLTAQRHTLPEALAILIGERLKLKINASVFAEERPLPDHLRVRVRVVDDEGHEICASRELPEIALAIAAHQREASASVSREDPDAWRRARAKHELGEQTEWKFGDVPERVHVCDQSGVEVYAFPGLKNGPGGGVALRLFKTPEEAAVATAPALGRLMEWQLAHPLACLHKDLKQLRELGALLATLGTTETLREHAYEALRHWACAASRVKTLTAAAFAAAVMKTKADLLGLVPRLVDLLREILTLRQALLVHAHPYRGQGPELTALVPADFLRVTPYPQLAHFPRYLKAMKLRADRWKQAQVKDTERAKQLAPFLGVAALRWQVEELRVSLFAQELGTAEPVSVQKLERTLAELKQSQSAKAGVTSAKLGSAVPKLGAASAPAPVVEPVKPRESTPLPVTTTKPKAPLKSFGSLDALFRK